MSETTGFDGATTMRQNGLIYFCDQFSRETTKPVIEYIIGANLLPKIQQPDHITLILNSPGGAVDSCLALIESMRSSAIPIHTVGIGMVASCGLITFMAGEKGHRTVTPNTSILSHQFSGGAFMKAHDLFSRAQSWEMLNERIMAIYQECTGLNRKKIEKELLCPTDRWLTAEEAVAFGLADNVVDTFAP